MRGKQVREAKEEKKGQSALTLGEPLENPSRTSQSILCTQDGAPETSGGPAAACAAPPTGGDGIDSKCHLHT